MSAKRCARCGKPLETPMTSVRSGGQPVAYYCHDSARSCYVLSTWEGYPEIETADGERDED